MRKLLGTIVIIIVLYAGFFGIERYDINPFIIEWLGSDKPKELADEVKDFSEKAMETTDSTIKTIVDNVKE